MKLPNYLHYVKSVTRYRPPVLACFHTTVFNLAQLQQPQNLPTFPPLAVLSPHIAFPLFQSYVYIVGREEYYEIKSS
jgi:hypothetical protein